MVHRVMLPARSWFTLNNMSVSNRLSTSLFVELLLVVLAVNVLKVKTSNGDTEGSLEERLENNQRTTDHQFETPFKEDRMKLVQLDPIKVGFIRQMELEPGKFFDVETVAMKPPIFLIHNFLTSKECDEIKHRALAAGLRSSTTLLERPYSKSTEEIADPYYNNDNLIKFDGDKDNVLNITEAVNALSIIEGVTSLPRDVFQYILDKFIDVDSSGYIDYLEFRDIASWITSIKEWIDKYERNMTDPKDIISMKTGRSRISQQAWLNHPSYDPNGDIANRLITLTGLHPEIIHTSEQLQVVYYTPGGHYHAHHDSCLLDSKQPCEHTRKSGLYPETNSDPTAHLRKKRTCRFITILYYLENTEEGGETAFPAADDETYSTKVYWKDNRRIDPKDLKNHCHDANLVLKPKKGLAVMWYNHYIENEWLGESNMFSLHGGCDVIKGEKWIANNWITVDDNYEKQIEFHKLVLQNLKESQNRDSVDQAPVSEQESDGNYLPATDKDFENEENGASHFISDQEDITNQENQIRNEL